ncbi:MAG: aminotransferase class V-fold PLP-dependent enzyme [Reichenbachiella sp.]|uniref:aminotransferase class V-fold PLP-dependent enzyme n=1 Tax=Reichenbachiella sp. TaxID=2184521 RepID=UPI003296A091
MKRRNFLSNSSLAFGAALALPALAGCEAESKTTPSIPTLDGSWESVRNQFILSHKNVQMAQMLFASHPYPVRKAIEMHRQKFDESPVEYWEENFMTIDDIQCEAAAKYMGAEKEEIALTDSTTMGLALLYSGLKLKAGDEILSTTHDHFVTDKAIDYAAAKNGATVKRIAEYDDPAEATVDEITSKIAAAISEKTRIVAITWVHSCDGLKHPIKEIAEVVKKANSNRDEADRIYLCVDGVHGFGVENIDIKAMGCDFFCAGTHKWIFGPRGTGIIWAKKDAWDMVLPTIPAFSDDPYNMWMGITPEGPIAFNQLQTPGGFHTFEHRWSLHEGFKFQMAIGKEKVESRTRQLALMVKEGIAEMNNVKGTTPMDPYLSSGINGFRVKGMSAEEVVKAFHHKGVIASASPYLDSIPRLTPCVINTEEEVQFALKALREISQSA